MKLVIMESPYSGDIDRKYTKQTELNISYARKCVRDSLNRGEAPIASHLLYTQPGILRDEVEEERNWGINAGLAWHRVAELVAVYGDLGISLGMEHGISTAEINGTPIEYRTLEDWPK